MSGQTNCSYNNIAQPFYKLHLLILKRGIVFSILFTNEALAKVSNEHPPQPLPSREGK
jgi:hypothetical protein